MSAQGHTPGPWDCKVEKTQGEGAGKRLFIGGAFDGRAFGPGVAEVYTDSKDGKANARLIAASPQLLDALKKAAVTLATLTGAWRLKYPSAPQMDNPYAPILGQADAAIAKAEAEGK